MSRALFSILIALVGCERVLELVVSHRHARRLRARGAREAGQRHYPAMVLLHTGLLVAAPLEVWLAPRPFLPWLGWPMLGCVGAAMAVRYWVVVTLGERWTTRVLVLPGEPRIRGGPYRLLRHPNYLAVAVEVAALPLVHTAWITASAATVLNALLLRVRIRAEDEALDAALDDGQSTIARAT